MIKRIRFILFASIFFTSSTAFADGNILLKRCQAQIKTLSQPSQTNNSTELWESAYCLGVLEATIDTYVIFGNNTTICLPEPAPQYGQLSRIAVKFMENNPEYLHLNQSALILIALGVTFPCDTE